MAIQCDQEGCCDFVLFCGTYTLRRKHRVVPKLQPGLPISEKKNSDNRHDFYGHNTFLMDMPYNREGLHASAIKKDAVTLLIVKEPCDKCANVNVGETRCREHDRTFGRG